MLMRKHISQKLITIDINCKMPSQTEEEDLEDAE